MIILGIDPGTTRMGYGFIQVDRGLKYIDCGVIGNSEKNSVDRIVHIGNELEKQLSIHKPNFIGIEKIFFSKNKTTAISVAEARGVVLYLAGKLKIPIFEFSPSDIKRVVAGDGACNKSVLAKIVAMSLGIDSIPHYDDASDALAIAIRTSFDVREKKI